MVHMPHVIVQPAHRGKCNLTLRADDIPLGMFSSDVISQLSKVRSILVMLQASRGPSHDSPVSKRLREITEDTW